MFGRRNRPVPAAEHVRPVVVFDPDARGAALAQGVVNGTAGHLNGTPPMITPDSWHGWTVAPQPMTTGLAGIGGRAITGPPQTYDKAQVAASTPVQRILEDRMSRGLQ